MAQVLQINGFSGGFSDDKFVGQRGSFRNSRSIDIKRTPGSLKLGPLVEEQAASGLLGNDDITAMLFVKDEDLTVAVNTGGEIFVGTADATSWTKVYTIVGANGDLENLEIFGDHLYISASNVIHRILVTDTDEPDWTSDITENYKTLTPTGTSPMIVVANNLYIGAKGGIDKLDSLGVITLKEIDLAPDSITIGLTFWGNMMRIYTRDGSGSSSDVYLWDTISEAWNEKTNWKGIYINAVTTRKNGDYVFGGPGNLYVTNGLDRQLVKKLPVDTLRQRTTSMKANAMTVHGDNVIIGMGNGVTKDDISGGLSWGSLSNAYPDALSLEYPTVKTGVDAQVLVNSVLSFDNFLLIARDGTSGQAIDRIDFSDFATDGFVETLVFKGDSAGIKKLLNRLNLSFSNLAVGEEINIYFKKDFAASWGTAVIKAQYATSEDRDVVSKRVESALGEFYVLEVKIELVAGTNNNTTPEFFGLDTEFDNIKDN